MPQRLHAKEHFPSGHLPLNANIHTLEGDREVHDHDFWEAALILKGTGQHSSLQGVQPLQAGDAFLLRPGTWHRYQGCSGLVVFNCCFAAELVGRELAPILQEPALNYLLFTGPLSIDARGMLSLSMSDDECERSHSLLKAMLDADTTVDSLRAVEKVGHLILFLATLARAAARKAPEANVSGERIHPAVPALMRMLEENLAYNWSLADIAARACLEPSYCIRLFKAGTGLSPMAYLARCRAERAAALLLRTELTIGEIGERVGWPDPNYFARRFRTHFGMSATAYRTQFSESYG